MTSLTRGPLPPSVYWRRRLVVLSLALLVVLGAARLLAGGGDGSETERASTVAADTSTAAPTQTVTAAPTAGPTLAPAAGEESARTGSKGKKGKAAATEPVLAEPQGRCDSADVVVTPEVPEAVAGRDVAVVLQLRTAVTPACTWRVSPSNLALNITSGSDDIWSTRECPRALPVDDVVIRNNVTTPVTVTWRDAARMDDDCARISEWALPGYYHATAAALGGEPSDVQFELEAPSGPSAADARRSGKPKRR